MVDTKNPAIAAYLAEVARAKRKAQESREAREGMEEAFSTLSVKQGQTQGSREAASTARATYGIIESKDGGLELRLPPAPREPDPGDCCQSGCNPCILITYQEMLESYNKNIDKLREEYARLLEVRHHLDFAHPIDSSGDNRPLLHSSTPSPSPSPSSVIASPVEASVPAIDASALITPLAFHNIRIHAVHNPSPFTIIFELEWTREQLPLVCGQHVHVRVPLPSRTGCYRSEDSEKPAQVITRPFTPVFRTDAAGVDRACLYIRIYDHHPMSTHFKTMDVGDKLLVRGPIKTSFDAAKVMGAESIVLIAAGSGITPIYQILDEMYRSRPLMSSPCDRRQQQQQQILVVYACRTVGEMWLKPQIDHLLQQLRSRALGLEFKFHVFISQGTVSQLPPSETFELQSQTSANTEICFERLTSRRLQDDVLRWLLGTSSSTAASAEFDTSRAAETQAVVCGPATFNRDVRASLIEFGLSHITCLD